MYVYESYLASLFSMLTLLNVLFSYFIHCTCLVAIVDISKWETVHIGR